MNNAEIVDLCMRLCYEGTETAAEAVRVICDLYDKLTRQKDRLIDQICNEAKIEQNENGG